MTKLETAVRHILPEWRMKLSTFDNINDPFELLCADQGDTRQRRHHRVLRRSCAKLFGFLSFSTNWRSPLMWAHYADSHTGVCIGVDMLEEDKLFKVIYEPERLKGMFDHAKSPVAIF